MRVAELRGATRRNRLILVLAAAAAGWLTLSAGPASAQSGKPAKAVTPASVESAIRRGVQFIWSQQNSEGHWETKLDAEWKREAHDPARPTAEGLNRGGLTALAILGLVAAGENPRDARLVKSLNWLAEQDGKGTYMRGLRAALWAALVKQNDRTLAERAFKLLKADAELLRDGIWPHGTYAYSPRPADVLPPDPRAMGPKGDFSNNQYGVLGVWAGADGGLEIPAKYWLLVQHGYLWGQQLDGGWRYPVTPEHKAADSMYPGSRDGLTLGGLASLFLVWDNYYARDCDKPVDPELVKSISRSVEWLGKHFDQLKSKGLTHIEPYTLYALERAGVASGLKYFGKFDWALEGARIALNRQADSGAWHTGHHYQVAGTAWTILFLVHARAPVVFNKLAFGRPEDWNARPRDLANLTRWMTNVYEKKFSWQIVSIDSPAADLQDAPILYLNSRRAVPFPAEQKAALKRYVEQGGTILAAPVGKAPEFIRSMQALVRELWPDGDLAAVPPDAPLYNVQFKCTPPPQLLGLTNGVRWTVLISTVDLGCPWQLMQVASQRNLFHLAANLYVYASDGGQLNMRGQSYLVADAGNRPARTLTVGRLAKAGALQADPEPAGWLAQDVRLRNANLMGLTIRAADLAEKLDPAAVPLLHVTGTTAIALTDQAKANLKQYLEAGGLVLADAAGGSEPFAKAFAKLIDEICGPGSLAPAPADLPFLAEATDGGKVAFRHRFDLPMAIRPFDLQAVVKEPGKVSVLFLPYDLSAALVGYPSQAPAGLTPAAADKFVTALLKWRAGAVPPAQRAAPVTPD